MPTVFTHAIVGAGLATVAPVPRRPALFRVLSAGLAMLPDLDVVSLAAGVPWSSTWSHRGIAHSLPAALVVGTLAALAARRRLALPPARLIACLVVAMASHGVLDAFTNGGLGIAFFAPFDDGRYFFPWRPVAVSPLGLGFFSARGARVLASEITWIWLPTAAVVVVVSAARNRHR
jgi:inner membrane protein